ncbi:hypothetical protein V5O48_012236 [Marasmius crinis-equi]|uniref:MYND-type domain-containing protein n=1 Tax=Marasmius crinis-equi TaxID=585013 RepID=A0ABR3F3D4_9AGAR
MIRTPQLQTHLAHAWAKTVALEHQSIHEWALALSTLAFPVYDESEDKPQPIPDNKEFTSLWIRHTLRESFYIKHGKGVKAFYSFISIRSNEDIVEGGRYSYTQSVVKHSISAHTRLLSTLLTKKKDAREAVLGSDESLTYHGLAVGIAGLIEEAMVGLPQVLEAVEAGLLVALFKSYPIYFRCDFEKGKHLPTLNHLSLSCRIIVQINKFLVYPSVFHAYRRVTSKIRKSADLEEELKSKGQSLWICWYSLVRKARILQAIRDSRKKQGRLFECSYSECKNYMRPKAVDRYRRCSGCSSVIYCSADCQTLHWKERHRNECRVMRINLKEGKILSNQETHFFKVLTRSSVLHLIPKVINEVVDTFVSSLQTCVTARDGLSMEVNSIADKTRNPILVVDFTVFDFPRKPGEGIECFEPTKFAEQFQARLGLGRTLALIEQWKAADVIDIFVVSLFPKTRDEAWSLDEMFLFPLDVPEQDDNSDAEENSSEDSNSESGDSENSDSEGSYSEDYTDESGSNEGGI